MGRRGFIDRAGKLIVPPQFSGAWNFSEGLCSVERGGKSGYIDTKGRLVIPLQFDTAMPFVEGRARVQIGRKWGYIDRSGHAITEVEYDQAEPFSDGLALIAKGPHRGFLNPFGGIAFLVPPHWYVYDFREGFATVIINDKHGCIDKAGALVIPATFESGGCSFEDGLSAVRVGGKWDTSICKARWSFSRSLRRPATLRKGSSPFKPARRWDTLTRAAELRFGLSSS